MVSSRTLTHIHYKDKLLWIAGYPAAALSYIFFANDNDFADLVRLPTFYSDLLFALIVTFLAGLYIRWITLRFDKTHPWYENFRIRLLRQLLWGVLLPLVISMLLEVLYLLLVHIPLASSSILNLELPLSFMILLLANLFYLVSYLWNNRRTEFITIREEVLVTPTPPVTFITVQKGFGEEKLPIEKCAVIESRNKFLWLHTYAGESFRVAGTLEEWEEKLSPANFYRINRQFLAAADAITSIEQTNTRKLKINLVIPADDVYVSKLNAAGFRQWWKNGRPS